jgi:hypothetical protein
VAAENSEPGFTLYDLHGVAAPRSARELPRLVLAALRIVWAAGRREAALALARQIVGGLGAGAMVLAGLLTSQRGEAFYRFAFGMPRVIASAGISPRC